MPSTSIDPNAPAALSTIRKAPLSFGSWGELKRLYKELEAETAPSPAQQNALAALIARFDAAPLVQHRYTPVAQINSNGRSGGLASCDVRNGRGLFVSNNRGNALQTADFNVADRLKPRLGSLPQAANQTGWLDVTWAGTKLAVLRAMNDKLQIVDVSDLDAPKLRGTLGGKGLGLVVSGPLVNVKSIAGSEGVVYAACNRSSGDTFHVISLADPDAPRIVGSLPIPGASFVCVVPGTWLVAVLGSGPLPETLLSSLMSRVGVQFQKGDTRYVHLVDVSRPEQPRVVSTFPIAHSDVLAADQNFLYVPDNLSSRRYEGNHGVNIIDIINPSAPRNVSRVPLGTYYTVKTIACYNGFVYAAPEYSSVKIIDARNPSEPKLLRDMAASYPIRLIRDGETLYAATYGGPQLLHLGDNGAGSPSAYGTPPSAQTLAYMKRRARRYLTHAAKTNPAQFPVLAARFLTEPGSQEFNPAYQWIAVDLLFGGGGRFTQASHGRGTYKETHPRGLSIRRREERFPEIWDAHPGEAAALFSAPAAVWPAREMALRVLRNVKYPVPPLDSQTVAKLLDTPSLLLIAEGVNQAMASASAGKKLEPATAALAIAKASAKPRRRLLQSLAPFAQSDAQWGQRFADILMTHLPTVEDVTASRRDISLAALFAQFFPAQITGNAVLRLAPLLLATKRPDVYAPILEAARREGAENLFNWVRTLSRVSDEPARNALLSALMESVQNKPLDENFYDLILLSPAQSQWVWPIVRASRIQTEVLRRIWDSLLSDPVFEEFLRLAMASPDALALLGEAKISDDEMAGYLEARPEIVDLLTPDAFARLTQTLSPSLTLRLAAAASNTVWANLREGWLRNLREGIGLRELWTSAEAALKTDATGNLEARLLDDADVAATFGDVDDIAAMLEIREPSFAPLLGAYFARHAERVAANDALFLLAATHALPEVRTSALALLPDRPIGLPLALGLLESEVPASVGAGLAWFDNPASDLPLLDRALALCDSPASSVRGIGRDFALRNRDALPLPEFSAALTEHADPQMQAFVARLLNNDPAPQFDREILRTRYQSRQAKEVVKTRQENQANGGSVDMETLLALARGSSTPRDAEWALTQLTRRALAGEAVEGLVVEGTGTPIR